MDDPQLRADIGCGYAAVLPAIGAVYGMADVSGLSRHRVAMLGSESHRRRVAHPCGRGISHAGCDCLVNLPNLAAQTSGPLLPEPLVFTARVSALRPQEQRVPPLRDDSTAA